MCNKFINTVCFMRSYNYEGHYAPENIETLKKQMALYKNLNLPVTNLLEYDALVRPDFCSAVKQSQFSGCETGLWFEITGELCRDAGIPWRSERNRNWDFYVNPGFIMSYSLTQKQKLIDAAMQRFYSIFGHYPRTVGAWLLDTQAMAYFEQHYEIDAFIVCREQWGMDGYTLWGGPYYGGYYPSKNNMQTPATLPQNQLTTPVFRMYVNDPIYCYYEFAKAPLNKTDRHLFTQEPAWLCGQDPGWVEFCFNSVFNPENLGFCYLQLGQETGFGYPEKLEQGLTQQCRFAAENQARYGYRFATVSEMGRAFKQQYQTSPATLRYTLSDWAGNNQQSVWFSNQRYRVNLVAAGEQLLVRDLHLFCDEYTDKYLKNPCTGKWAVYDNPPIIDGVRFTPGCDESDIPYQNDFSGLSYGEQAGLYFNEKGRITAVCSNPQQQTATVTLGGLNLTAEFLPTGLCFTKQDGNFALTLSAKAAGRYLRSTDKTALTYCHNGLNYCLKISCGSFKNGVLYAENGKLILTPQVVE